MSRKFLCSFLITGEVMENVHSAQWFITSGISAHKYAAEMFKNQDTDLKMQRYEHTINHTGLWNFWEPYFVGEKNYTMRTCLWESFSFHLNLQHLSLSLLPRWPFPIFPSNVNTAVLDDRKRCCCLEPQMLSSLSACRRTHPVSIPGVTDGCKQQKPLHLRIV